MLSAILALVFSAQTNTAAHIPRTTVRAVRAERPPVIDGSLSDQAWSAAIPESGFTQRDPDEGQPPTERTELRVLYDDAAIYIGVLMFDRQPDTIARRLSSRDESADADQVTIYLDPRFDHQTGVAFTVSAAGVQRDLSLSNDTAQDDSWDAVWDSAVRVDERGWTAELRIPLSQLRFNASDRQTWGINVERFVRRRNEFDWLELIPKQENGQASRMAHLTGLDGIRTRRHVELVPYTAGRTEHVAPASAGDPFNDGSRQFGSVGLDLRASVTTGLTLDATINPDFGQAEVDPAVVNLSAFETFFQEKRRFFIEGSEIFNNFGVRGANNFFGFNTSDPIVFYSRRVGRAPQGSADGSFVDVPRATTMLGAAKLTGKTANGWSIGLVNAVTGRERARVTTGLGDSTPSRPEVEPLTNYFVARVQRDFSRGGAGMLATSVVRRFSSSGLSDLLTKRASVVGADGFFFFDKARDWVVTGKVSVSEVAGSAAALARIQRSPEHYYQRPDAPQVVFDPMRTSLRGFAGRVNLNRNAGVWRVNAAAWGESPGFESNDLGFTGSADRAGGHLVLQWVQQSPDRLTRYKSWFLARAGVWNYNRETLLRMWYGCGTVTFINYWFTNVCSALSHRALDDRLTRGGPLAVSPAGRDISGFVSSDGRKALSISVNGSRSGGEYGGRNYGAGLSVVLKPSSALTISTGPEWSESREVAQYVSTETDEAAAATFGRRDVFATLDQTQLTLATRVNYVLTPRSSIQVFMQPLLATGGYTGFKELAVPRTYDFNEYSGASSSIFYDVAARQYAVDPDGVGPLGTFSFGNPDYNFKSLRLNAILRWEVRPGSTLYVVWTQQREDFARPGIYQFKRDAATLFAAPSNDIVLVKMTYWIGR